MRPGTGAPAWIYVWLAGPRVGEGIRLLALLGRH